MSVVAVRELIEAIQRFIDGCNELPAIVWTKDTDTIIAKATGNQLPARGASGVSPK